MDTPAPANDDSVFESFPNYQNFPSQWDLSELDATAQPACSEPTGQPAQFSAARAEAELPIPVDEAYPVFSRDPFPKLRTFPVYWDLSR